MDRDSFVAAFTCFDVILRENIQKFENRNRAWANDISNIQEVVRQISTGG
jgi:hypothetical protein